MRKLIPTLLVLILYGCSGHEKAEYDKIRRLNAQADLISRKQSDQRIELQAPQPQVRPHYPWENQISTTPTICKEFFQCRGSALHPLRQEKGADGKTVTPYADCNGSRGHGLPVKNGKPFIYPALIELLNYIQTKTGHRVQITSGHRCPQHNSYVDPSPRNGSSKHLIGAEVDFYVEGLEQRPEEVIQCIQKYYQEHKLFAHQAEFTKFQRSPKEKSHVATPPWYNKEIFVKLYQVNEGRNFDNGHPYPYISIQVRWDREKKETVRFQWEDVHKYMRH